MTALEAALQRKKRDADRQREYGQVDLPVLLQRKNDQNELRILRRKDLERLLGISRSQIYALIAAGRLPQPIRLFGRRSVGWLFHEVQEALRASIETSRRGA